jgi:hypothetical protein
MKAECPSFKFLIQKSSRLGLALICMLMIVSSPFAMLVNPALIAASPDVSTSAPSTISQDGSDFTTQAALSGVWARQTNNIVGVQSYYDIIFVTSTTGTIKFIDITFPPGTVIGAPPRWVEKEGIGAGNAVKASSTTISYTVLSPVSIPEGTKIRLEFFNLVNPTIPSTGYKVTVATKDVGGAIIDGPTASNGLTMKQIGTGQIADGAVTAPKIAQDAIVPATVEQLSFPVNVPAQTAVGTAANCPSSSHPTVTGGGFTLPIGAEPFMHASVSKMQSGDGWFVSMFNSHPTDTFSFQASATCMAPMP